MEFTVYSNKVVYEENGRVLAQAVFPSVNAQLVKLEETFVDESLRGQGVAGQLLERVAAELRASGRRVRPRCSYAIKWFGEHTEYADIVDNN